jgi:hypothetical protein
MYRLGWIAVGKLLVLETFLETTAAELDDLVDIVRRDIAATDIAVIIVLSVEWADDVSSHGSLIWLSPCGPFDRGG